MPGERFSPTPLKLRFRSATLATRTFKLHSTKAGLPHTMSLLCFQDAFVKRGDNEITEDVYLQSILQHLTGVRHGLNRSCNNDTPNRTGMGTFEFASNAKGDRFTYEMSTWVVVECSQRPIKEGIVA
jgi:hypothetical protein